MSYHSRTVSYKRMNLYHEDGSQILIMAYDKSYSIYPAALKYSRHGANDEYSTYYPMYYCDRQGCLREDTFLKLLKNGVLVDKTPDHTKEYYKFYTFPDVEISLYGCVQE